MKNLTLILFFSLLVSCQIKAKNTVAEANKIVEIQPSVSPSLSPSAIFSTTPVNDINSKIGVVEVTQKGDVCLTILNNNLMEGDKVSIVFRGKPQSVITAEIQNKLSSRCSGKAGVGLDDSFYSLKLSKSADEDFYIAFGLIGSNEVIVKSGIASIDLNGDKKAEYFRACTSMEGVHLTVWSGKPLTGKRIWHNYYYLGYDTEPTCKKKDYEGTDE